MHELWKDIPGYEGRYQASNLGRVRSLDRKARNGQAVHGRVLKQSNFYKGYRRVCFSDGTGTQQCKSVHSLVMLAFEGPCPDGCEILHWDGNKTNNHLTNLRYGTHSENREDSVRLGELTNCIPVRRSDGRVFPSISSAAQESGVSHSQVRRVLIGKFKQTGGFSFEYCGK